MAADVDPRLHDLRLTIAFLTRVPMSHGARVRLDRMARWFPVVGLLIGGVAVGVLVATRPFVGHSVSAVLAVLAGVLVTGGFHHDGLADSADGLVGGWTPEQRREILKDSRHGTYGVLALVLQVVLQVTIIGNLPTPAAAAAVVLMHVVGRGSAVSIMRAGPGVSEGMGADYVAGVRRSDVAVAAVSSLAIAVAVAGWNGAVAWGAALVVALLAVRYAIRRIGGIVGDVLGAAEQVSETTVLLTAIVFVERTGGFGW